MMALRTSATSERSDALRAEVVELGEQVGREAVVRQQGGLAQQSASRWIPSSGASKDTGHPKYARCGASSAGAT